MRGFEVTTIDHTTGEKLIFQCDLIDYYKDHVRFWRMNPTHLRPPDSVQIIGLGMEKYSFFLEHKILPPQESILSVDIL